MSYRAKFVKEIDVIDPDTKGHVRLAVYKHANGGMLAIDSSFIDQVVVDRGTNDDNMLIYDPFADLGYPEELFLED